MNLKAAIICVAGCLSLSACYTTTPSTNAYYDSTYQGAYSSPPAPIPTIPAPPRSTSSGSGGGYGTPFDYPTYKKEYGKRPCSSVVTTNCAPSKLRSPTGGYSGNSGSSVIQG